MDGLSARKSELLYLDYYNTLLDALDEKDTLIVYEAIWGYVELDNMGSQRPSVFDEVYKLLGIFLERVRGSDDYKCPPIINDVLYELWTKRGSCLYESACYRKSFSERMSFILCFFMSVCFLAVGISVVVSSFLLFILGFLLDVYLCLQIWTRSGRACGFDISLLLNDTVSSYPMSDGYKLTVLVGRELEYLFGVLYNTHIIKHEDFGLGEGSIFSCRAY